MDSVSTLTDYVFIRVQVLFWTLFQMMLRISDSVADSVSYVVFPKVYNSSGEDPGRDRLVPVLVGGFLWGGCIVLP